MTKTQAAETQFTQSLTQPAPPADWPPTVRALWHLAKGEWNEAHELVQHESGAAAAWVHAHLHRVEGDEWNAGYWYRRAGKPTGSGDLDQERLAIAVELISGG